jgi:curved DNA-binding protein CbpA
MKRGRPGGARKDEKKLFEVLRDIAAEGGTGTLEVRRGEVKSTLRLCDGQLQFPGGESLTAFLIREGKLTDAQIEAARKEKDSGEDLIRTLIRLEVLSEPDAKAAALEYLDKFLTAVAAWGNGYFEFHPAPAAEPTTKSWGHTSCLERIVAMIRGLEDPAALLPVLEDEGAALEPVANAPSADSGLDLKPEEGFLLSRITGKTTVKEFLALSPSGADEARKSLAVFLAAGLVKGSPRSFFRPKPRPGATPGRRPGMPRKKTGRAGAKKPSFRTTTSAVKPPAAPSVSTASAPGSILSPEAAAEELLQRMHGLDGKNHYEILEVGNTANSETIRLNYYELARHFHPDRFHKMGKSRLAEQAEKYLSHVTEAYRVLGDMAERQRSDRTIQGGKAKDGPKVDPASVARQNFQRGLELLNSGQTQKSLQFFENAVKLDVNNDKYLAHLAQVQMRNPRLRQEARKNLQKAVQVNPSNVEALIQIGILLDRDGKTEQAVKKIEEALTWEPNHPQARRLLEQLKTDDHPSGSRFGRLFRK